MDRLKFMRGLQPRQFQKIKCNWQAVRSSLIIIFVCYFTAYFGKIMDLLLSIYGSVKQVSRSDKEIRFRFYSKLQAVCKLHLPTFANSVILWPQEVTEFLVSKGHLPSSTPPMHGYDLSYVQLNAIGKFYKNK